MKKLKLIWETYNREIFVSTLVILTLAGLLLYRLGTLNKSGLSYVELQSVTATYGWHGLYNSPLYLPLKLIRSVIYTFGTSHSQLVTRLPNVLLGGLTIGIFAWLIKIWHGNRTAILSTVIFATSAWVLHVSRLASYDVMYLTLVPALLLSIAALQRHFTKSFVFYGSIILWGMLLYIPGAVWLITLTIYWERKVIKSGWKHFKSLKQRTLYVLAGLVWLPLLIIDLRRPGILVSWLGLPSHIVGPMTMLKNTWNIFFALLIHGPSDSSVWLVNAPIFDIFALIMVGLGIYFYIKNWRVGRARILLSFFIVGVLLSSLGGLVSLTVVVPLLFICAATGIAYLIHEWLQVFPINPFARTIGISLVVLAISLSSLYNLRSYFIAWPNNSRTETTFHYKQ